MASDACKVPPDGAAGHSSGAAYVVKERIPLAAQRLFGLPPERELFRCSSCEEAWEQAKEYFSVRPGARLFVVEEAREERRE